MSSMQLIFDRIQTKVIIELFLMGWDGANFVILYSLSKLGLTMILFFYLFETWVANIFIYILINEKT